MKRRPKRESFYAIRRTDGEDMFEEVAWYGCNGPEDWDLAEQEAELNSGAVEYEIVQMRPKRVGVRTIQGSGGES